MNLSRQDKTMVAVLLSGALLVILNATLLSPALPAIMADLSVTATTVQWLTSAYLLGEAVVIPLNAFLVGRFSTRQLFLGGIAFFSLASALGAFAPHFSILLVARIMMALAAGVVMPMVFTLIVLTFPREKRGAAMGIVGLIIAFAPAIGPSLSGVLVDYVGWRAIFVIVAGLGVLVLVIAAITLRNHEGFERVPFDVASIILLACGIVCLLYGISSATSAPYLLVSLALIALGAVLLGVFVRRQFHLEVPVLRISVLSSRPYRTAVALIALLQASLAGSTVILPIYVQQVREYGATVSGLLMLPGAVLGAFLGLYAGRVFDRRGVRSIALAGAVAMGIGGVGIIFFNMAVPIWFVALVYTTIAAGMQLLITPLNTWGLNSLDNSVVQHANSLGNTVNQIAASAGTAFIVSLTALAPHFAASGASEKDVTYAGIHIAFLGMCVLLMLVVAGVVVSVRDKLADAAAKRAMVHAARASQPEGIPLRERRILVADVMNTQPAFLTEEASVRDAIMAMREGDLTGIPVVDAEANLSGFLTDGDVMRYLAPSEHDLAVAGRNVFSLFDQDGIQGRVRELLELPVARLATKRHIYTFDMDDDAQTAFATLSDKRIRKAPVLAEGKLVGTLSRRDVLNALMLLSTEES